MPPGVGFLYVVENGEVSVVEVKKRVNPCMLKGKLAFIENWNLHKSPSQGRGLVLVTEHEGILRLGVVYKLFSTQLIALVLLLKENDPKALYKDIDESWVDHFDFIGIDPSQTKTRLVQQVSGTQFKLSRARKWPYPFVGEDGGLSTTPMFEDIVDVPAESMMPKVKVEMDRMNHLVWRDSLSRRKNVKFRDENIDVDVLYVNIDDGLVRSVSEQDCFGVAFDVKRQEDSFNIVQVWNVERRHLKELQSSRLKRKEVIALLEEFSTSSYEVLVPKYEKELRIKLATPSEFEAAKEKHRMVSVNGRQYLYGKEPRRLEEGSGIVAFSSVKGHPKAKEIRVSYRMCKLLYQVYGCGYNQRSSVPSIGFNSYRGKRLTSRPGPSPTVAHEHVAEQQYKNGRQGYPLCQVVTEKFCNELGSKAEAIVKFLNEDVAEIVQYSCSKGIMTFGAPKNAVREGLPQGRLYNPELCLLAFCNRSHVDPMDSVGDLKMELEKRAKSPYAKYVLRSELFCILTTAVYQHVWNTRNGTRPGGCFMKQYFILDGLGIGLLLEDYTSISFFGNAFSHLSSVAFVEWSDKSFSFGNKETEIGMVFAWGRTGGRKEVVDSLDVEYCRCWKVSSSIS